MNLSLNNLLCDSCQIDSYKAIQYPHGPFKVTKNKFIRQRFMKKKHLINSRIV